MIKSMFEKKYDEGIAIGEARGEARGKAQGEEQKAIAVAQKMKAKGYPASDISEITGLSLSAVKRLG